MPVTSPLVRQTKTPQLFAFVCVVSLLATTDAVYFAQLSDPLIPDDQIHVCMHTALHMSTGGWSNGSSVWHVDQNLTCHHVQATKLITERLLEKRGTEATYDSYRPPAPSSAELPSAI